MQRGVDFANRYMKGVVSTLSKRPNWDFIADRDFLDSEIFSDVDQSRIHSIDGDISSIPSDIDDQKVHLICVANGEQLLVRHFRKGGHHCIGLFSDLARRHAAFCPPRFNFTDKTLREPTHRFAILSLPRAASTVLALEMEKLGIGKPKEHIQSFLLETVRHRNLTKFKFPDWRRMLETQNAVNGIFSSKIIWDFYIDFKAILREDENDALHEFMNFNAIARIRREDKYAQAVSDYLARRTKVWHKWPGGHDDYEVIVATAAKNPDFAALSKTFYKFERSEREIDAYLREYNGSLIEVSFDEISVDPVAAAHRIARHFDIGVPERIDAEPTLQPTRSEAHDALADKLKQYIANMPNTKPRPQLGKTINLEQQILALSERVSELETRIGVLALLAHPRIAEIYAQTFGALGFQPGDEAWRAHGFHLAETSKDGNRLIWSVGDQLSWIDVFLLENTLYSAIIQVIMTPNIREHGLFVSIDGEPTPTDQKGNQFLFNVAASKTGWQRIEMRCPKVYEKHSESKDTRTLGFALVEMRISISRTLQTDVE